MPSHRTHRRIAESLGLGGLDYIDSAKDSAAPYLGKGHRRVGHDLETSIVLAAARSDDFLRALARGVVHDTADRAVTQAKSDLAKATGLPRWVIDKLLDV